MQTTRKALLASLLISATVVLGIALAGVPNVELMTITVFVAGYMLGARLGVVVGVVSITVHSLLNPLGAALPPLLLAQVVGFLLIGLGGALVGPRIASFRYRLAAILVSGVVGFLLTFIYDICTNIGAFFTISGDQAPSSLIKFVTAGLAFMAMHLVWNATLFFVVLTPVVVVLKKYRLEIQEGR